MTVGAIVVSYNSEEDLDECLTALRSSGVAKIVVVDNCSTDGSVVIARRHADHVIESASNVGFGRAVNHGARVLAQSTKYYIVVNPDCTVSKECVASMTDSLEADARLAAVAPKMLYPDGSIGISGGPRISLVKEWFAAHGVDEALPQWVKNALIAVRRRSGWPRSAEYLDKDFGDRERVVRWISGFCLEVRSCAFAQVAGFDESFFMYFEDVDFCDRLQECGWQVAIIGGSQALHRESASSGVVGKSPLYIEGLRTYISKRKMLERAAFKMLFGTQ